MPDPTSGSVEWYHGEGSINFIGHKMLRGSQGLQHITLEIRAYNLDDTYDHHPIVRIDTSEV
jgi:hypothetical protein